MSPVEAEETTANEKMMNECANAAEYAISPSDELADSLWRQHVESNAAGDDGAMKTLLASSNDDTDSDTVGGGQNSRRESTWRFCLRGHELSGLRRGALRSSADKVAANALRFRRSSGKENRLGEGEASAAVGDK